MHLLPLHPCFLLTILSYILIPATSQIYEIQDLDSTIASCFDSQSFSWVASLQPIMTYYMTSTCYSQTFTPLPILGGPNKLMPLNGNYFQKGFSSSAPHNEIRFAFTLYGIDRWNIYQNTATMIEIFIDGVQIKGVKAGGFMTNLCGDTQADTILRMYGKIPHTASSVTIRIGITASPTFQSSQGSFGVREFSLLFVNSMSPVTPKSMCGIPLLSGQVISAGQCSSSVSCHPSCEYCSGSLDSDCYKCKPGYAFDGSRCIHCSPDCSSCSSDPYYCLSCSDPSKVLYGGTCVTACPYPMVAGSNGCTTQCRSPCIIGQPEQIIYPGQPCDITCDFPLTLNYYGSLQVCENHCASTPQPFLNYDGTCLSACPPGLGITVKGTSQCAFPCGMDYLYWDGTCDALCNPPFISRPQYGKNFCDSPCRVDQHVNLDGSCRDSCNLPFRISGKFCLKPCDDPMKYYDEATKQCKGQCNGVPSTSPDGYLLCSPYPKVTQAMKGGAIDFFFVAPTEPDTVTFITLTKFMQYVRYLDIKLPPRLEGLSVSKGRSVLSLQPTSGLTMTIYSWFNNATMAPLLERQHLHPRFLANFGGQLFVLIILLGSAILFSILTFICKRYKLHTGEAVFEKFQILTRWNLCFMMFATYFDDIVLYSALEFVTLNIKGSSSIFSFIVCVGAILGCLGFMGAIYKIVMRPSAAKVGTINANVTPSPSNQSCQIFFGGFNPKPHLNKLFFLFYVCRSALPILLAMVMPTTPIAQVSLQVVISLLILGYALSVHPLTSRINQYQLCLIEGTVLIMNIGVLVLTIFDNKGIYNNSASVFFGDLVILGNVAINVLVVVILAIKVILMVKDIITLYKKDKAKALISSVHFLALPLQQGAFGFEQLIGDVNPASPPSISQVKPNVEPASTVTQAKQSIVNSARIYPSQPNTQKTLNNRTTTNNVIDEEPSGIMSSTDRLGQSSARLLMSSSQVFNQSQVDMMRQGSNVSINMNESGIDLGMSSPKHKRALSKYLKNMSGQGIKGAGEVRGMNGSSFNGGDSVLQAPNFEDIPVLVNRSRIRVNQAQHGGSGSHLKQSL